MRDRERLQDSAPTLSVLPVTLFETAAPGGGIGLFFDHARVLATAYGERKRFDEQPFSADELMDPDSIDDPIRRKRAGVLSSIADDLELLDFAKVKLNPDDEVDHEETYGHHVDMLVEDARQKAISFKEAVAGLTDSSDDEGVTTQPADQSINDPAEERWLLKTAQGPFPRVSNNRKPGTIKLGGLNPDGKTLKDFDPLDPKYAGLKDLREDIVAEATGTWVIREDHPWYRWALLQRGVEWGSNLVLFGLTTDPEETPFASEKARVHLANPNHLEATRHALQGMSSRTEKRTHEYPSFVSIRTEVRQTAALLRRNRLETTIDPTEVYKLRQPNDGGPKFSRVRELQNLSTRKLGLTDETAYPNLKATLFGLEVCAIQETGGPNSAEAMASGPDVFEAVLLGALTSLKQVIRYLDEVSPSRSADPAEQKKYRNAA